MSRGFRFTTSSKLPVPSDHKSFPQTSPERDGRIIFSANQSRKGRKNPEPGTGVPGKESNGNQVPFRGRHNQLDGG